jgi:pimeloyl-ACP methyl ester carboxylesterase
VDQIGDFGKSLQTRPLPRRADLVAWLTELLDALDLRRGVHLVSVSYGGALATEFARRNPERTARLVLLSPAATVLRLSTGFIAHAALVALARKRGLPAMFRWLFEDAVREIPGKVDAALEQARLHMRCVRWALSYPRVWTDSGWRSLVVPKLFLAGEREKIYPARKALHRLSRVAPQVCAEIVAGAGHDLTLVRAAEVNRRIHDFLAPASVG